MCDLTADEKDAIVQQLDALQAIVDQIKASARTIEDRNWLEHDEVSQLLVALADKANEANHWVHEKAHSTHG